MRRGFALRILGLGLLGALVGAALGSTTAEMLTRGFVVDWYVSAPADPLPRDAATNGAILLAMAIALVVSPLASFVELYARSRKRALPPGPRTPGTHAVIAAMAHTALLVVGLAGITIAGLGPLGADADKLAPAWTWLGALGGFVVGAQGAWWLGRRIAQGEVGSGSDNLLAGTMLTSARFPKTTLAIVLVVTLFMAQGVALIQTDVNVADVLPRGDPNTDAAQNLTVRFKSAFTQQTTLMFRINPDQWAEDNARFLPNRQTAEDAQNISDEVYIRAMYQAAQFFASRPPFIGTIAVSDFYRLINWTMAGGNDAPESAFSLPGTDFAGEMQYLAVDRGVWGVANTASASDAIISPSFRQASMLVTINADEALSTKAIGEASLRVRDDYVAWAESSPDAYKVFTGANKPLIAVELPVANAHASELANRDFRTLLPIIVVWIGVVLFVAFRNLAAILVAMGALVISTLWTFGAMGYMGIPLSTLNLTVIPLILGVGIDYSLHIINEFQENRAAGKDREQALRAVSRHAALALFIANLNTIAGLMVMVASPSLLIAQLGVLASIAIGASYLLMITFMPAALGLMKRDVMARRYRPSEGMAGLARGVGKYRAVVLVLLLVGTVVASAAAQRLQTEAFGDPPRNWLPDDPLRIEHEAGLRGFYDVDEPDVKANVLVFEGAVTTPESHAYMDAIEASLRTRDLVISDTLRTLPFLLRTYLTVRDGVPGAGQFTAQENLAGLSQRLPEQLREQFADQAARPYPRTQAEIEQLTAEAAQSPLKQFLPIFIDYPRMGTAIMIFSVRADTYEDAAAVWDQVWGAVWENNATKPEEVQVAFVGNTATNYLFIAKELPWLQLMSLVTNVLVVALVYIPTRDWRPTLVVGVLNFITSIWWLAVLPDLGIGLAITLTLPLVFIYAIGSDYGLHLALSAKESGSMEETFRTTGKSVLFSAIILFGAFMIFTGISNLAVQRTMLGTAAAIVVMFVVTALLVPALYKPKPQAAVETVVEAPAPPRHVIAPKPPPVVVRDAGAAPGPARKAAVRRVEPRTELEGTQPVRPAPDPAETRKE